MKGQVKKLPIDGIRFDVPMRMRIGHLLTLFQVSAPTFYRMKLIGKIPAPSGYLGNGPRATPYWLSTEIYKYI